MSNREPLSPALVQTLLEFGPEAPPREAKLACLAQLGAESPDLLEQAHVLMLDKLGASQEALKVARAGVRQAGEMIDRLSAPPHFPAIFLQFIQLGPGRNRALVLLGNSQRVVEISPELDLRQLRRGDQVLLTREQNAVLARAPKGGRPLGEMARFVRALPDGRVLLKHLDNELLLERSGSLEDVTLAEGDMVRFDRGASLAFERIEARAGHKYFLEQIPQLDPARVGGQEQNLKALLSAVTAALANPDLASRYEVTGRNTICLTGPPGCGKTLMAKVAASEVARRSGQQCRFADVKPSEWESPWVGETQRNIREFFHALNEAAKNGFAVAFFDEVEAVGRHRGSPVGRHADNFLACFLTEINGFKDRANVCIISATNRPDLLDTALLDRLSDIHLHVPRPDLRGARAIFNIHLGAHLPFSPNSEMAAQTRHEVVENAVSRLFSPNAENKICRLLFRDGKQRVISARELVSGRLIEQVCRAARRSAFVRDLERGEPGIQLQDMAQAIEDALKRLRQTLTPQNARSYLDDLPQDIDVVSVEPIEPQVSGAHRFTTLEIPALSWPQH